MTQATRLGASPDLNGAPAAPLSQRVGAFRLLCTSALKTKRKLSCYGRSKSALWQRSVLLEATQKDPRPTIWAESPSATS